MCIRDSVHAKLKPIHDTFMKKNFKLTKDAYAAQHKEELDTFNKAVRTLMKLNGRDVYKRQTRRCARGKQGAKPVG